MFLINLLPLWLIRLLYRALPPSCCFRTTTGRTFKLIPVDNDFCIAISSEKYDAKVIEKLVKMKQEGEELVETAINGINSLSFDERESALKREMKLRGKVD